MTSLELIKENVCTSTERVLRRIDDMESYGLVFPTPRGGCHTLWVLGHLAYIESLVIRTFMLGEPNPLAGWEPLFDAGDPSADAHRYPPFGHVLHTCRQVRASTVALLESLSEDDLDRASASAPRGWDETFGTYRRCLQYAADHWYMHRGHLGDARRAAGLERMWV
jgi:hypothetical protein